MPIQLLHQGASKQAYHFLLRWVFGLWLAIMIYDPITELALYPTIGYTPTGFLLKMFPDSLNHLPLSYPFLLGVKIIIILSCLAILLNRFKRLAGVLLCILLSMYQGILRSFGHINHPELMLLHCVFIFTIFFFFEESLEKIGHLDPAKQITVYSIPFIVILIFFSFTYVFAGIHRIVFGFDAFFNDSLIYWIVENSRRSRLINWDMDWLILQYPIVEYVSKAGLALVTVFEILTPFCLLSKWIRYLWLLVIIPFHIFVWLTMGIMFWENLTLFIIFINFTPLLSPQKPLKPVISS